jgi:hypothetical protein
MYIRANMLVNTPCMITMHLLAGWLARGMFKAESSFTDDDNATHLEYGYAFELKTDWN